MNWFNNAAKQVQKAATNVTKATTNVASKVAVDVGNSAGQFVPWRCSKCGIVKPVSEFEGNVVEGARCSACKKSTNVFKDVGGITVEVVKAPAKVVSSACGFC